MGIETLAGEVLTAAQRETFARDGLLLLDDPCPTELLDEVLADSEEMYNDAFDPGPEVNRDGVVYTKHVGGVERYHWHRVMYAWKTKRSVRQMALAPRVLRATEELFGRSVLPFQTLNFPVGTQQPPHIDAFFFNSDPDGYMCGVWIALEDMDMDNGPLVYYPGSHKLPLPTWEEIAQETGISTVRADYETEEAFKAGRADAFNEYARGLIDRHGFEPRYGTIRKGQALIWAPHLLHGGAPQKDLSRTRHSQVTHYYFEGCRHYRPLHTEPGYINWDYPEWIREPPPTYTIDAVEEIVRENVPPGATMLVASLGYEQLLELEDRTAHHFPRDRDGAHLQLHELGDDVVAELEEMRSQGAGYIVFPMDQMWRLEYDAPQLQQHLENNYTGVFRDGAYCVIYALDQAP
jgi:ectoine hydroxylase-related dioxygenase (phytanoyl-CoA dioxygenase family)